MLILFLPPVCQDIYTPIRPILSLHLEYGSFWKSNLNRDKYLAVNPAAVCLDADNAL